MSLVLVLAAATGAQAKDKPKDGNIEVLPWSWGMKTSDGKNGGTAKKGQTVQKTGGKDVEKSNGH